MNDCLDPCPDGGRFRLDVELTLVQDLARVRQLHSTTAGYDSPPEMTMGMATFLTSTFSHPHSQESFSKAGDTPRGRARERDGEDVWVGRDPALDICFSDLRRQAAPRMDEVDTPRRLARCLSCDQTCKPRDSSSSLRIARDAHSKLSPRDPSFAQTIAGMPRRTPIRTHSFYARRASWAFFRCHVITPSRPAAKRIHLETIHLETIQRQRARQSSLASLARLFRLIHVVLLTPIHPNSLDVVNGWKLTLASASLHTTFGLACPAPFAPSSPSHDCRVPSISPHPATLVRGGSMAESLVQESSSPSLPYALAPPTSFMGFTFAAPDHLEPRQYHPSERCSRRQRHWPACFVPSISSSSHPFTPRSPLRGRRHTSHRVLPIGPDRQLHVRGSPAQPRSHIARLIHLAPSSRHRRPFRHGGISPSAARVTHYLPGSIRRGSRIYWGCYRPRKTFVPKILARPRHRFPSTSKRPMHATDTLGDERQLPLPVSLPEREFRSGDVWKMYPGRAMHTSRASMVPRSWSSLRSQAGGTRPATVPVLQTPVPRPVSPSAQFVVPHVNQSNSTPISVVYAIRRSLSVVLLLDLATYSFAQDSGRLQPDISRPTSYSSFEPSTSIPPYPAYSTAPASCSPASFSMLAFSLRLRPPNTVWLCTFGGNVFAQASPRLRTLKTGPLFRVTIHRRRRLP
ncbi:hypothetical protein C8F01DRAFT_1330527 [Mycena amicta]|nr:hypothetical protein C8F01DRAFT_1330527 [Mycena amicta]